MRNGYDTLRGNFTRILRHSATTIFSLFVSLLSLIVTRRDDHVVVLAAFGYEGNSRAQYEHLRDTSPGKRVTWLVGYGVNGPAAAPRTYSFGGALALARSRNIVTDGQYHLLMRFLNDRRIVQLWHGIPIKRLGLLEGRPEFSRAGVYRGAGQWMALASTSPYTSKLLADCFGVPLERIPVTGYPRNDLLFRHTEEDDVLAGEISAVGAPEKVVLWAPTWREDGYENRFLVDSPKIGAELVEVLRRENAILLLKWHPYMFVERNIRRTTGVLLPSKLERVFIIHPHSGIDTTTYLKASSCLLTDFSSVAYDYLLLDRPVAFYHDFHHLESYMQRRGLVSGWEEVVPGRVIHEESEVVEYIEGVLSGADQDAAQRRLSRDMIHTYKDDQASERIARLIWNL